ncbi:MAG: hypothetical protein ACE5GA_02880 [Candidatus Zixiibacteriota bacterium]
MKPAFKALPLVFIIALSATVQPQAGLKLLETNNVRLVYFGGGPGLLMPHLGRCFENSFRYHNKFWNYTPTDKITLVMLDASDYGNAGALATPENRIFISVSPISLAYETSPVNERMNSMMNHEMVHIVALDKAAGSDLFFRKVFFGKVRATSENPLTIFYNYLTSPRRSAPRWYHEGIAVFVETWMAGGIGRALGSFDEMVFRTMVRDSARFYDPVSLESEGIHIDFQVGVNSYLYGTRFISYLALTYGPEQVVKWVSRSSGSKKYFSSQFKNVFGMALDAGWEEWIEWEKRFQRTNLDSIRQYPVTEFRDISSEGLGSMSEAHFDTLSSDLYVAVNFPGQVAHLAAISVADGSMRKICDVKWAAIYFVSSLAFDQSSGALFYTTDNNDWRDLRVVYPKTGESRTLIKDARVGDLTFNDADSALWGVKHSGGLSTLVRIPYPYEEWDQIHTWPYGKDMYDIDISPDGALLSASLGEVTGKQTLILMEIDSLLAGSDSRKTLFDFGTSIPATFSFSADGRYLYGSSYLSGVSNVFRYDFALDSMEALSNSETGFFRPLPVGNDSLLIFRYSGKGFIPSKIAINPIEDVSAIRFLGQEVVEKRPIVKEWLAPGPGSINLDSLTIDTGEYHALGHMRLSSAYPIVEGYKDFAAFGMRFNVGEPLGMHSSTATISYTPNQGLPKGERLHASLNHSYRDWSFSYNFNSADFYDLFGPTKTSRKGQSLGVSYRKILIRDAPKSLSYNIGVTGYRDLVRLPDYQNVATTFDRFVSLRASLNYTNRTASLGAVDLEKGFGWQLASSGRYVNRVFFPRAHTGIAYGFPMFFDHSSLWIRLATGYAYGERSNPFANYFFGGFGNNWVDHGSVNRYRRYYAFPGLELNEIGGKNFGKALVEWLLPPLRFRRLGGSSLYANWARVGLFAGVVSTDVDRDDLRQTVGSLGAQLNLRVKLLSYLKATISIGYAAAVRDGQRRSNEFMASLKVL